MRVVQFPVFLLFATCSTMAFSPLGILQQQQQKKKMTFVSPLMAEFETGVIPAIELGEEFMDPRRGGVALAEETLIKIGGAFYEDTYVDDELDQAYEPALDDPGVRRAFGTILDNFHAVRTTSLSHIQDILTQSGGSGSQIIAQATGKELYADPGESKNLNDIYQEFGPDEAAKTLIPQVKNALGDYDKIVVNALGGEDAITGEVMDAIEMIISESNVRDDAFIEWNSISFKEFPNDQCSILIVGLKNYTVTYGKQDEPKIVEGEQEEINDLPPPRESLPFTGEDYYIAKGEVYQSGDKFYVLHEDDAVEDFTDDLFLNLGKKEP